MRGAGPDARRSGAPTGFPGPRQRVVVTGAAAGAGRVVAEHFADAGHRVLVCDFDAAAAERFASNRPDIEVRQADTSCESQVEALFTDAVATLGGVDVLVNNVGIAGPTAWAEDVTLSDWNATLAANLTSHFLCARGVIPGMKRRGAGAIVNIASANATITLPMRLPYVVSKAAILSLTRNLAREVGPFGIRVNAILPGPIEGERMQRVIATKAAALGIGSEEYAARLTRFASMRTMVTPADVAAAVLFLASPAARFVSGQCLGVDAHLEYEE